MYLRAPVRLLSSNTIDRSRSKESEPERLYARDFVIPHAREERYSDRTLTPSDTVCFGKFRSYLTAYTSRSENFPVALTKCSCTAKTASEVRGDREEILIAERSESGCRPNFYLFLSALLCRNLKISGRADTRAGRDRRVNRNFIKVPIC